MVESRPDPEKILLQVENEERNERRGKLKIYLGSAPGVGKTYEMLRDAFDERNKGLDVVIGVAESHGREDITFMLKNFEIIPRQIIHYHDQELRDFDIDGALKRNPGLILIDEMAHTNAPGQRHNKRWQDIKELLDRGINVYTTLNVQHIESLNDDVAQIIQAPIKETVPDFMIDRADTLELVDIPPEELLKRLHDGKIYFAEQADLAAEHFFRIGNLIALRALALRVAADRVGAEVLTYRHDKNISQVWHTNEKILVLVGAGLESLKLIRAARRAATSMKVNWIAVCVETPRIRKSEEFKNRAIQNLRFAQQMGAETRLLSGLDIVTEVMSFAHDQNITRIMVWKTIRTRPIDFIFTHLADEIVRYSGEIDVYIMTGKPEANKTPFKSHPVKSKFSWVVYYIAFGCITLATMINFLLNPYFDTINLIMVYLLSIIIVSLYGQQGPSLFASFLSLIQFDLVFVSPDDYFGVTNINYIFTFLVMLLMSLIISNLTIVIRRQTDAARFSEKNTSSLYKLSRQLASTRGADKLLQEGIGFLCDQFEGKVSAFISENGTLNFQDRSFMEDPLSDKEQSIAQWVFDLGQAAGLGTDTLPSAEALYLPMIGSQGPIGVIRLLPLNSLWVLTPEMMHLLEACISQISLAIDTESTHEQKRKSVLSRDKNYINHELLQSIARELRAPLASIMVSASNQIEMANELTTNKIIALGKSMYFESEQLNRLINNFLQITYLESRAVILHKQSNSLTNTVDSVLDLFQLKLDQRQVKIHLPKDLPMLSYDHALLQDVFINLFDNAIKFTPKDSPIEISAVQEEDKIIISVEDSGPGIMHDEINNLFEKFYRGRMLLTEHGLGLGLAICHRIIKAHGGKIWAENRKDGVGASFRFTLPLITK